MSLKPIKTQALEPKALSPETGLRRLAIRCSHAVSVALFCSVFLVFTYKILLRYWVDRPVAWADEVSVVLFIWLLFWGNAFVVDEQRQIKFDLFYRWLPEPAQRLAAVLRYLLVGGLFCLAFPSFMDYILFLKRERTPVLGMRLDGIYLCFGLFSAVLVVRSAGCLVGLCRANWRRYL